jgi:hypothetical protein
MTQITFDGTVPPTANPLAQLDANFTELYKLLIGTALAYVQSMRVTGAVAPSAGSGIWGNDPNLIINSNGAEAARFDTNRSALFGISAPTFSSTRMEVVAATNTNAVGAKTTQAGYAPVMAWNADTVGTATLVYFYTDTAATLRGSITYNRGAGLVVYNTTSDYRAKDLFGPVTDSGAAIDALRVYRGKMKGATIERPMMVAHELQTVAPYAVTGQKDAVDAAGTPVYQQVSEASLVPLLIAEIQSLRQRLAAIGA